MNRVWSFLAALLICPLLWSQQSELLLVGQGSPAAAAFSQGLVKITVCASGSAASYPCTATWSTGDRIEVYSNEYNSGTGNTTLMYLSSVTASGESFTHCPNQSILFNPQTSATSGWDCYTAQPTATTGGTVTAVWTNAGLTSPTIEHTIYVVEYSYSGGTPAYDSGNAVNATGCTSCVYPPGRLSGTKDSITQGMTTNSSITSGPSSPYTSNAAWQDNGNAGGALGYGVNLTSYTAPTWVVGSSGQPNTFSFMAWGGSSSPQLTLDGLLDLDACTNGLQVTGTCLNNSTFAGASSGWSTSGIGAGLTASTAVTPPSLPVAVTVDGLSKSGSLGMSMHCVTDTSGAHCGSIIMTPNVLTNKMSMFFTVRTSCSGLIDCGAASGIFDDTTHDYIEIHFQNNNLHLAADGEGYASGMSYSTGTDYRIGLLYTAPTSGGGVTEKMIVCAASSPGTILSTQTITSQAVNATAGRLVYGISGEEPTTSGFTYDFSGLLWSDTGLWPASGCW